jgi:ElaB/YqjD/DUF883 family membrane-anchored ribosome-binding protein
MLDELRSLVSEAEDLLGTAEEDSAGPFDAIRSRVEASLGKVKDRLDESEIGARAKSAGKTADAYVRENPWTAVAIAVGLGYLIGRIGRRD